MKLTRLDFFRSIGLLAANKILPAETPKPTVLNVSPVPLPAVPLIATYSTSACITAPPFWEGGIIVAGDQRFNKIEYAKFTASLDKPTKKWWESLLKW